MQNLEPKTKVGYFWIQRFKPKPDVGSHSSPPKCWRTPPPLLVRLSPKLIGKGICCKVSEFEFGAKRQRHGDKSCWGHPYLWKWQRIRLRDRVWSHLMMAKKLLSTWWILFCIGPIFRYHEFFLSEFVSENPSLRPPFCQLCLPWAPPLCYILFYYYQKPNITTKHMIQYKCCI